MYVCQLLEKRVIVRVREEDVSLAEELMESATQRYEDKVGLQVKVKYTQVWCMYFCQFLEKRVVVPIRDEDILLAEELMGSAMQRYKENVGMEVNLKYTQSYFYKLLFFNTYLKVKAFIVA